MAKCMTLHTVAAAHYAEARKHQLSPLEWGPDEQEHHLVELLLMRRRSHSVKMIKSSRGKPVELVCEWAWLQATRLQAFREVQLTMFDEETHIERIKALALIEVMNDKLNTKQA